MTDDTNDILGLMGESNDEAAAPALPTLNLNLSLSDEDLEQPERVAYVPIPQHTTTNFKVYQVEAKVGQDKNGNSEWRWSVTFKAEEDTWGPGKMVRDFFTFRQSMAWKWGPFLKAVGLIKGAGDIDPAIFNDPSAIEDVVVSARVAGYSWKQRPGIDPAYPRSYGDNKVAVPTDGTKYYEDLADYKPAGLKSDEGEDKAESLDGLAAFSKDEYL